MAPQIGDRSTVRASIPVLVSPTENAIVDGRRVTFVWEGFDQAVNYRLQIAADTDFEQILCDLETGRKTEITVEDVIPVDENTYFWRVVAQDRNGDFHGEANIESFISGTPAEEGMHFVEPNQDEEYGPIGRLVRGAKAEAAAEVTHGVRYVEEEEELGVEHEGIVAGEILGLTIAIGVALALIVFTMVQYVDLTAQATREAAVGLSGYPEKREAELRAMRQLTQYGIVDSEQGVYRIPVERAIEIMSNETLQGESGTYTSEVQLLPNY